MGAINRAVRRRTGVLAAVAAVATGLFSAVAGGGVAAAAPGSLDSSFGFGGLISNFGGSNATGLALVPSGVTGTGNLIVPGSSSDSTPQFQVTAFSPSGGEVWQVAPAGAGEAGAVAVVPASAPTNRGDIVAVGYSLNGSGPKCPLIAELTPSGALNASFGTNGVQTVACPAAGAFYTGVAVTPTGAIVAVGQATTAASAAETLVTWLSSSGGVTNSTVETLPATSTSTANAVAISTAGTAVTAGWSVPLAGGAEQFTLAAFDTSGALVPGFGTSGVTTAGPGVGNGVTALPNGDVVAAGANAPSAPSRFQLTALGPSGTVLWTNTSAAAAGLSETLTAVAYQQYGDLVVATGTSFQTNAPTTRNVVIAQYHASNGAFNTSFGFGGIAQTQFTNNVATGGAGVAAQNDGKTVVAATVPRVNAVTQMAVMRALGPSLTVGNGGQVVVYNNGPVSVHLPVTLDETLSTPVTAHVCAPGAVVNSVGSCANVNIPAGLKGVTVTVTVNVANTAGHTVTVSLQASPGNGFSLGRSVGTATIVHLAPPPSFSGYWFVASDGGIFAFGHAAFHGSTGALHLNKPIVGMAPTPNGGGYWLVASDGGLFAFGNARFFGSTGALHLNKPIVGMAATPDGRGYWLVASDGGLFAFGDARFFGSTGGLHLNKPIVAMATTPDGGGYWLVSSDGGLFAFGDAHFFGSTGGLRLVKPIVSMAVTTTGAGYWLVASDGGIFAFGDARFFGSTGGIHLNNPIVGMAATYGGRGYWLVASDGGIFSYGNAPFFGSTGSLKLNKPIVGMAA
jgi:hypothetical protein